MEGYDGAQFVGIDLHRRRTVLVRTTETGEVLEQVRINNDAERLVEVVSRAGEHPEVVLEATYGWYWAVDALQAAGARVHLAHPLGVKAFAYRRVKNDVRDATDLADLLRMGRLPEAWIARRPPASSRAGPSPGQAGRAALARQGSDPRGAGQVRVHVPMSDLFGLEGNQLLDRLHLPAPSRPGCPRCAGSSTRCSSRSTCSRA